MLIVYKPNSAKCLYILLDEISKLQECQLIFLRTPTSGIIWMFSISSLFLFHIFLLTGDSYQTADDSWLFVNTLR